MGSSYQGVKLEHRTTNKVNYSDREYKDIKYDAKSKYIFFLDQSCKIEVSDNSKHSIPQTTWIHKETYHNPCNCKPENMLPGKILMIEKNLLEFYLLISRKF